MLSVAVQHTWEAGHRLPHIEGKCQSLHGHSWHVEVEVTTDEPTHEAVLIEFATIKRVLRAWIDSRLDHGLMLGRDDALVNVLAPHGKVFVMGYDEHSGGLDWPTVENVATLIQRLIAFEFPDATVLRVTVRETPTNAASWRKDAPCRA
ncbi:QueD-like Pre Qo pathway protein [Microbacterium phage Nicole72]|uniref:QueD-like Pre Qo pathway protein n=1 Tax=Microbacterium phage Nicole72 TaxID=3062838 RepID=A0ACD4UHK9_9CAUD|nr:QueD-like Pre Qo pathway protein [Microbacterium phage Nicole72]